MPPWRKGSIGGRRDIDLFINRTLVYGSLTGTLAGVYFGGSVATLQHASHALTGCAHSWLSWLLRRRSSVARTAAPSHPGLHRPRFYRRRYDARNLRQCFSAKLRDETALDRLGDELVSVVGGTMQPAHASLWLRPPGRVVEEKGEAKCEKIVGEEFRNAFRNVGETVDNYNGGQGGQMTAPTENKRGFWQNLLRPDGSKVPEENGGSGELDARPDAAAKHLMAGAERTPAPNQGRRT